MPRVLKVLAWTGALLALVVGGTVFAALVWPGLRPKVVTVAPDALPRRFLVLTFWTAADGQPACAVVPGAELEQARAARPELTLTASETQAAACRERLREVRFASAPADGGRQRFEVSSVADDDLVNRSTYSTDGTQLFAPRYREAYGPVQAATVLFAGTGFGVALWIVALVAFRRRR